VHWIANGYNLVMARQSRQIVDGGVYHVLNRGNCKMPIFEKHGDFAAFITLLEQARRRSGMRILGFCLMNNHWHLVLWPKRAKDLSSFIGWLCTTHVRRWRQHRQNNGEGHLYQGRFKSFLVEEDLHFLVLMRYVEANAFRAGIVKKAKEWPWSSLAQPVGTDGIKIQLTEWPVDRPRHWIELVNEPLSQPVLEKLQSSVDRNRPFGKDAWIAETVARLGLHFTIRTAGRPKKTLAADKPKARRSKR
jgi:putative transposase